MTHLQHVGVLGMKWGIRKRPAHPTHSTVHNLLKTKKIHELSNEELVNITRRLQLEKQFKDLTKRQTSRGQKIVTDILLNIGGKALNSYISGQVANDPNFQNFKIFYEAVKNKMQNKG